jgi:acrylyl-CoA reductase (NADPH)
LVSNLDLGMLDSITTLVSLAELPALADDILVGKIQGRVVIDVNL